MKGGQFDVYFPREGGMNMAKMSFKDLDRKLTEAELQELEDAAARSIVFDEESPEMTPEMLSQFKRIKQKGRNIQTICSALKS